jgi:hypothetical protein
MALCVRSFFCYRIICSKFSVREISTRTCVDSTSRFYYTGNGYARSHASFDHVPLTRSKSKLAKRFHVLNFIPETTLKGSTDFSKGFARLFMILTEHTVT